MLWLARHFPGLRLGVDDVGRMLPEETRALQRVGQKLLKGEADERLAHTKVIAMACGARLR